MPELLFNKGAGWRPVTLLTKGLQHEYFYEFGKTFKNMLFEEPLLTVAYLNLRNQSVLASTPNNLPNLIVTFQFQFCHF